MGFMTSVEAGEKWNLSKRRVAILCAEGRVPGAEKKANVWLIPDDAEKPVDARIKSGKYIKNVKPNKYNRTNQRKAKRID